ncbi:unnamed protein product [Dicrocoelium dendriticum]|nr:unnamed protein product [Dicrocoelium dendriticum]
MVIVNENDGENVELKQVENYEEFLSIDNELQLYDGNEECDAALVARIAAKHTTATEDHGSGEENPNVLMPVTKQDARKCIETLHRYCMQEGNEGSPITALHVCGDFVRMQSVKRMRQPTLDTVFKRGMEFGNPFV